MRNKVITFIAMIFIAVVYYVNAIAGPFDYIPAGSDNSKDKSSGFSPADVITHITDKQYLLDSKNSIEDYINSKKNNNLMSLFKIYDYYDTGLLKEELIVTVGEDGQIKKKEAFYFKDENWNGTGKGREWMEMVSENGTCSCSIVQKYVGDTDSPEIMKSLIVYSFDNMGYEFVFPFDGRDIRNGRILRSYGYDVYERDRNGKKLFRYIINDYRRSVVLGKPPYYGDLKYLCKEFYDLTISILDKGSDIGVTSSERMEIFDLLYAWEQSGKSTETEKVENLDKKGIADTENIPIPHARTFEHKRNNVNKKYIPEYLITGIEDFLNDIKEKSDVKTALFDVINKEYNSFYDKFCQNEPIMEGSLSTRSYNDTLDIVMKVEHYIYYINKSVPHEPEENIGELMEEYKKLVLYTRGILTRQKMDLRKVGNVLDKLGYNDAGNDSNIEVKRDDDGIKVFIFLKKDKQLQNGNILKRQKFLQKKLISENGMQSLLFDNLKK